MNEKSAVSAKQRRFIRGKLSLSSGIQNQGLFFFFFFPSEKKTWQRPFRTFIFTTQQKYVQELNEDQIFILMCR